MTRILILSHADVESLMPFAACIPVMEQALADLARGNVANPLRQVFKPEGARGFFGLMPAYRGGEFPAFGLKEVCVFPDNPSRGLDTHLGAVLLHSAETGELQAVINASAVTAIRTAAVSAVATRLLANPGTRKLAIIGSGAQARSHLLAMNALERFESATIVGRDETKVRTLVDEVAPMVSFKLESAPDVREAVRGAGVVVTATSSREPVLFRDWVEPGTHINAVGSSIAAARELESRLVADASLFVDRRESTLNESGDFLFARRDGLIGPDHIRAEIGEILIGAHAGRSSAGEVTLFKSLGLAIEDLASAQFLYNEAMRQNVGSWVEFG